MHRKIGVVKKCHNEEFQLPEGQTVVKVDPNYYRATEVGPVNWRFH